MKTKMPTPKRLPSGSWRVQIVIDGKRVSITADTPKEAQARAIALRGGILDEKKEKPSALTLSAAIDAYIESKSNILSPSTIRGYDILKRHRFKSLMQRDIHTLTRKDIQDAVNAEAAVCSPKTVSNAYGLLSATLRDNGIRVVGIRLPQKVKPKKQYLQPEDFEKLMTAARGDLCETAILLAVCLGLRTSEIMGLCADCVDVERGTITIRRTSVPDKNNKNILKEGAKNEGSQRTVPCPPFIMEKLAADLPSSPKAPVFKFCRSALLRHVHAVCQAAGIADTTTHGLRHTNAAIMRHLGISDHVAMERGGWSDENTYKKVYSYVFASAGKDADTQINDFFEKIAHENAHEKK